MTYRIRVEHRSHYEYARTVHSSYNEARLTPLTTPSQLVLDSRLEVSPGAPLQGYVDYWGTVVHSFDLEVPHEELTITGRSVVETMPVPAVGEELGWAELESAEVRDRFAEYLAATGRVPADRRLSEIGKGLRDGTSPAAAASAAISWVCAEMRYVPGATGVHTSAVEAWEGRQGVCQDFAHLTLALLRAMGIPSRYCSGYTHPDGNAAVGETVRGESHAWIEYWSGEWHAADPTAGGPVHESHVLVARGRDYGDVTPIKGIFHGGPTSRLEVTVELTRLS